MKRTIFNILLAILLTTTAATAFGQKSKKSPKTPPRTGDPTPVIVSEASDGDKSRPAQAGTEVLRASDAYKASLRQLIETREAEAARANEQFEKMKPLFSDGLVSKQQLDESEGLAVEARHRVEEAKRLLAATDNVVAERLAENTEEASYESVVNAPKNSYLRKVAYIRYNGNKTWSPEDIGKVEQFFLKRFKRKLPVSANGQSDFHTQLGFDHRNAIDIAVSPDSAEGKALMAYLSKEGIPFIAYRRAVPGSATGPHIHIGTMPATNSPR